MLNRLDDPYSDVAGYKHVLKNNIGFAGGREVENLDTSQCELSGNIFGDDLSDSDFLSLDETQLTAPRQPDGSLPAITFMHLRPSSRHSLILSDDFGRTLDPHTWIAEIEPKPGGISSVYTRDGALILNTRAGVTLWLNRQLTGDNRIEFDREVIVDTGHNDRLSDMNVFWMASDPKNPNLFTRDGRLAGYDDLRLYYVGMGGNTNKTTRFRKYSNGERKLIAEYTDAPHLLRANKIYHIAILTQKGTTSFWVDGNCFFSYADPEPLTAGYFGFRSTWSRQAISHFRVYSAATPGQN